jgi:hypothetical protein
MDPTLSIAMRTVSLTASGPTPAIVPAMTSPGSSVITEEHSSAASRIPTIGLAQNLFDDVGVNVEGAFADADLSTQERDLVRRHVESSHLRSDAGESLEEFQKTRNAQILYSTGRAAITP